MEYNKDHFPVVAVNVLCLSMPVYVWFQWNTSALEGRFTIAAVNVYRFGFTEIQVLMKAGPM